MKILFFENRLSVAGLSSCVLVVFRNESTLDSPPVINGVYVNLKVRAMKTSLLEESYLRLVFIIYRSLG